MIAVRELFQIYGGDVNAAERAARCTKCGAKGVIGTKIIFIGNSEIAMSSAYTREDKEDNSE